MKHLRLFIAFVAISLAFVACKSSSNDDNTNTPEPVSKVAKAWSGDSLNFESSNLFFGGKRKLSDANLNCTSNKNFTVKLSSSGASQTGTWSLSNNDTKITFTAGFQNAVNEYVMQNSLSLLSFATNITLKSFSANNVYDIVSITDNKMKIKGTASATMTITSQGMSGDLNFTSTFYFVVKL
jgi:hypothetical protein